MDFYSIEENKKWLKEVLESEKSTVAIRNAAASYYLSINDFESAKEMLD